MERYLRVNLLGLSPRLMKKIIYRAAVSQRLRNTGLHNVLLFSTDSKRKLACYFKTVHCRYLWPRRNVFTARYDPSPFFLWFHSPSGPRPQHWVFEVTLRHTTLDRTHLDEWSARRRDPYVTTHNTHKGETSMLPAGLEHAIPTIERP